MVLELEVLGISIKTWIVILVVVLIIYIIFLKIYEASQGPEMHEEMNLFGEYR